MKTTKQVNKAIQKKPPLGILSIATYLKRETDFEIRLLDSQLENLSEIHLAALVRDFQPDVVGISVTSFELYEALVISQVVKEARPQTHVCWGGPHLSIFPKESLSLPEVDSIVLGDGEVPFARLCHKLSEGKAPEDIEGVYIRQSIPANGKFKGYFHPDLNTLPVPDLAMLPYKAYQTFLTNNQMATAVTARGCPFKCIFCKLDHSKLRLISQDKTLQLIESCLDLGVKEIEFYDETFNINVDRVKNFAREVLKKGLKFKWSFRGRIDQVDAEMLELAKAAGCQRIQYGVEAGTDRVLKLLRKGTTVEKIRHCFNLTNKAGIDTVAYLILGSPGETMAEMAETVKMIREVKPTYVEYYIFNILPGTKAYQMALEEKVIERDYWQDYAAHPQPQTPELFWTQSYSYAELEGMRKRALKDFYARPSYFLNRLRRLKPREAARAFMIGLDLLKSLYSKTYVQKVGP
jgi:radical SAM superfamily enzyme YgiQ (UPF0313 family)